MKHFQCHVLRTIGDRFNVEKLHKYLNNVMKKMDEIHPLQLPEAPVVSHLIPV